MNTASPLPIEKIATHQVEAGEGLLPFLRRHFYLLLPVLLTFLVLTLILTFALLRRHGL